MGLYKLFFHRHLKTKPHLDQVSTAGKYLADMVYGANDGIITTFAVVAGTAGASLSPVVTIILGFSNLLADGISMGASDYLGLKSEKDFIKSERKKEYWEISHLKQEEINEIRKDFESKGFKGEDLSHAIDIITSNKKVWVDTMMKDELGLIDTPKNDPKKHALATFVSFAVAGLFPLLPFLIPNNFDKFLASTIVGAITLFAVGASRSFITTVNWFRGGVEMLTIGSATALVAYFVGSFIESLVR